MPRRPFPSHRVRRILAGTGVTVGVLLVLALAAILYVRSSVQDRRGTVRLEGVAAPVEVIWDEYGVPQVWATTMADAVFAQGFLHARDRLWQMDLVRRAVSGRLAEVMGEDALESDRFMRRLGLHAAAAASLAELTRAELRLLEAYAAGVNAALDGWSGALPPEFLALRYRPEPWEPVHTMAVAKMMAFTLGAYDEAVGVARAIRSLGPERARHLFPAYPDWGTTILEPPAPPEPPEVPPLAAALVDAFSIATASNAWVVSGDRTASGRPILANDPHLQLQAPSLWYLIGLHAPVGAGRALDVVGVSIPGAPLVILGHNRAIAWGMTNAYVKDVDIFLERTDPADPSRYLVPGGSEPFQVITEQIRVKGRSEPVPMEVRRTRHGPVLPAAGVGASSDTLLAVQWTALRPSTVFRGILGMNLARDWAEFLAAAKAMDEPHQNLVYADTAGHIGYVLAGMIPIRGDRRPATPLARAGWTGEWDWTGSLPFDERPQVLDPPAGYIVTANNRQTVDPVADLIGQTWLLPFRAQRITEMIRTGGDYTAEDMLHMQFDLVDLFARRYVDRAIEAAEAVGLHGAVLLLGEWDQRAAPHSRAASIFYVWSEIVRRAAATDLYGGPPGYFTREAAADVLERRALPWRTDGEAAYQAMATDAIRQAVELVAERPWSALNRVVHRHTLGGVPILDRFLGLNVGPAPHYGAPHTVNVALWAFRTPAADLPFTSTAGVSMRHVVDMGNLDAAGGFVIGTGQSGIPFSSRYSNQQELWSRGGLIPLPLSRDAVERRGVERMRIDPVDDRR